MIARFGRPFPVMSMITKELMNFIYNNHQKRLTQWNQFLLSPASLQEYTNAIHRAGAALDNCFGFIDGTVHAISRPGKDQRLVYNGHKRVHALKFQSVSLPMESLPIFLAQYVGVNFYYIPQLTILATSLPFVNTSDFNIFLINCFGKDELLTK